jgi:hypothetical protein
VGEFGALRPVGQRAECEVDAAGREGKGCGHVVVVTFGGWGASTR